MQAPELHLSWVIVRQRLHGGGSGLAELIDAGTNDEAGVRAGAEHGDDDPDLNRESARSGAKGGADAEQREECAAQSPREVLKTVKNFAEDQARRCAARGWVDLLQHIKHGRRGDNPQRRQPANPDGHKGQRDHAESGHNVLRLWHAVQ